MFICLEERDIQYKSFLGKAKRVRRTRVLVPAFSEEREGERSFHIPVSGDQALDLYLNYTCFFVTRFSQAWNEIERKKTIRIHRFPYRPSCIGLTSFSWAAKTWPHGN